MLVELQVGDYWDDGHGKSRSVLISTDYNSVESLYNSIYPLLKSLCTDYEDNLISYETADSLRLHGANFFKVDCDDESELYYMDYDSYVQLVLDLMAFKDPAFTYEILEPSVSLDIGGYGLF